MYMELCLFACAMSSSELFIAGHIESIDDVKFRNRTLLYLILFTMGLKLTDAHKHQYCTT